MSDYKPTEHGGLRKDGEVDQRTKQDTFAHGKVDPVEAGKKGGQQNSEGGSSSDGSADNAGAAHQGGEGLRKDGQPDQRLKMNQ